MASHMKTEPDSGLTLKRLLLYALAYVLWLVNVVVCIVAVIQLRATTNVVLAALGGNRYSVSLVNQVIVLVAGLAAFIYVVFLEGYYRESIAPAAGTLPTSADAARQAPGSWRGRLSRWLAGAGLPVLLRRFALTTAIPLGIFLLSYVLLEVSLCLVAV